MVPQGLKLKASILQDASHKQPSTHCPVDSVGGFAAPLRFGVGSDMAAPRHRRIPLFISTAYIPLSPSFSLFLSDAAPDGQHRNAEVFLSWSGRDLCLHHRYFLVNIVFLDEDIVMNDPTPVDPSTGVPQLEQKTPDNQGEPEAEAPDSQNDRREVVASVLVPEQLTEVHHEPEQETEAVGTRDDHQELVRPNAPMVNSPTGALREAGRESENVNTENDGQEVARVVQAPQHKNGARLAPRVQAAN
ncbi:hypothetical protein EDB83DRAFT_2527576 [Lactarius deliciosus]|nr:hypothetical protein EDB83DRAFT_2527576 [Lactarius deliciosus]